MAHYSKTWECRVCAEHQESIDLPKVQVCEDCLEPVAARLCSQGLGVALNAPGVDRQYWMAEADAVVRPMMRRWQKIARV